MPELLDICDSEGHLTGQKMARSEAHRQEQWHRVAVIWVINSQGEILVQQRAEHLSAFPGLLDVSVAGHVSSGEEPTQTAVRELQEELGVEAVPQDFRFIDTVADRFALTYGKTHQEYDFVFVLHRDVVIDDLKLQAAEVTKADWMSADDFERGRRDTPALYAQRDQRIYDIAIEAARARSGVSQA